METAERDGPRERGRQDIEAFFKGGLDNSSSNIGKHINDDPGMGIPKFHCVHYAQAEHKREICKRLAAVLRYSANRHGTDLGELFLRLKGELSCASGILAQAETADGMLLATILYEIVQTHLGERRSPEESVEETAFGKVNMKRQVEEYYLTCDCYEATSIDFFFALRRMAGQNVIASSNLAGFYYVGMEFVVKNEAGGPHGTYVVERNLEQAAHYFKRAASSQPPYAPALYSYGYMLLHGETENLTVEQRMEESERYYRLAAAQKFHHAVSGLGDLALLRAERLLKQPGSEVRSEEIVTIALSVVLFLFAPQLMRTLTPDSELILLGTKILRIEAFAELMYGTQLVCAGILQGRGDTLVSSTLMLGSLWLVRVPLSMLLIRPLGLVGAWLAMSIELNVRGILFLLRFQFSKR